MQVLWSMICFFANDWLFCKILGQKSKKENFIILGTKIVKIEKEMWAKIKVKNGKGRWVSNIVESWEILGQKGKKENFIILETEVVKIGK